MKTKTILMGAAALVGLSGANAASAQTVTNIYGGGSTLIAPYLRQAADCYGVPTALVNQGSTLSGAGANETTTNVPAFRYTGTPAFNCATRHFDPSSQINYIGSGSGNGIATIFSHDPVPFWGDTVPGTDPSNYPTVTFAASDNGLGVSDVNNYNNGGVEGSGASAVNVAAPGVAPTTGQYANPHDQYGALVQFPLLVAPVALAFSTVYEKRYRLGGQPPITYSFNIRKKNADGSGGLLLTMPVICGIVNGQITDWADPAITALNGGVSLQSPLDKTTNWHLPIELVGRSDGSGTTSIFTRALAAQCNATNGYTGPNAFADGATTLPTGVQGPVYTSGQPNNGPNNTVVPQTGKFTLAKGSGGVAQYLTFNQNPTATTKTLMQGRLGYIGPDFTLIAQASTGQNYNLSVVDIARTNANGTVLRVEPTAHAASLAFASLRPPQSGLTGTYAANSGTLRRANPYDWVEPRTVLDNEGNPNPLANPSNPAAYPITGTTNFLGYTCYANADQLATLQNFLGYYFNSPTVNDSTKGLIAAAGFAPMPAAWQTAITQTFLSPVTATRRLNLYFAQAGQSGAPQCGGTVVGG